MSIFTFMLFSVREEIKLFKEIKNKREECRVGGKFRDNSLINKIVIMICKKLVRLPRLKRS